MSFFKNFFKVGTDVLAAYLYTTGVLRACRHQKRALESPELE